MKLRDFMCILALGVPYLGACQRNSSSTQPSPSTVSTAAQVELRDDDIGEAIQRYFGEDATLHGQQVHVTVTHGIAELSGSVTTLLAQDRAGQIAGTIRGIRAVVNRITVAPSTRTDPQIKSDVTRELDGDLDIKRGTIGVTVQDGIVMLSGPIDSWQERALITDLAKGVPGVRGVENETALHYETLRPPDEVAAEVRERIRNDAWLDGTMMTVTVKGRQVTLSGVVSGVDQKLRAYSDAWVAGVVDVVDDGVIVDWHVRDSQRFATDFPLRSDAQVAQAVREAFLYDPRLKTLEPAVLVKDGVAVLSGTVDSVRARRAAEADARGTVGVWFVRDQVLVAPNQAPTDADIDRAASRVLLDDGFLEDRAAIRVSTSSGKVTLTGTVASAPEPLAAEQDVEGLPGVVEVDNRLTVKGAAKETKAAIEGYLYWDALVPRHRVSVAVGPDGVATLTGTLDSWAEIKAASDDALRGGANRVIDLLKLKGHPEFTAAR